jgi:hypothetical protein
MIVQYPNGNFRFRVLIISFHGLGNKKKNFQQKIDGNFHFRILGMTSVPDFR